MSDDPADRRPIENLGLIRRVRNAVGFPLLCFVLVAVVLGIVVWFSTNHMDRNPSYGEHTPIVFHGASILEGWVRYDAGWYVRVSAQGYDYTPGAMSSVAYFPAYPTGMHFLGKLLLPYDPTFILSGIILTFFSGMAMIVLLYRWCCLRTSVPVARLTVLATVLFPYAWFLFGAIYADAFFLAFTMAAFVLIEKDHPVLAGCAAAVATAARPVGVGVFIGLLAVQLDRRQIVVIPFLDRVREVGWRTTWRERPNTTLPRQLRRAGPASVGGGRSEQRWLRIAPRRVRPGDAGVLVSLGGLVAWCWYLGTTYGHPFLFAEIEGVPGWDQAQGPHTWLKIHWLGLIHHFPEYVSNHVTMWDQLAYTLDVTFQGLLAFAFLLLIPLVIKKVGWPYAVYVFTVVGIPIIGTKDWQGTGRYLLAAFPVFAALASWLLDDRARLKLVLLGSSALLLVFLTSAFARGYYLA